jgi:hypothetical protein
MNQHSIHDFNHPPKPYAQGDNPVDWLYREAHYRLRYDPERGELIWKRCRQKRKNGTVAGYLPKNGYRFLMLGRARYRVAQLIWLMHHGYYVPRLYRLDGNPANHRLENLHD